jgi:hypothetical protein
VNGGHCKLGEVRGLGLTSFVADFATGHARGEGGWQSPQDLQCSVYNRFSIGLILYQMVRYLIFPASNRFGI